MGYHVRSIKKGQTGEISKIREEVDELEDAVEQGTTLMALLELSDIIGAITLYLEKHHPSLSVYDLIKMADRTRSAFEDGSRK